MLIYYDIYDHIRDHIRGDILSYTWPYARIYIWSYTRPYTRKYMIICATINYHLQDQAARNTPKHCKTVETINVFRQVFTLSRMPGLIVMDFGVLLYGSLTGFWRGNRFLFHYPIFLFPVWNKMIILLYFSIVMCLWFCWESQWGSSCCLIIIANTNGSYFLHISEIFRIRIPIKELQRYITSGGERFSKNEIKQLMLEAGLENIEFSNNQPFWCSLGYRK